MGHQPKVVLCARAQPKVFGAHWLSECPAADITQFTGNFQNHPKMRVAGRACTVVRLSANLDEGSSKHRGTEPRAAPERGGEASVVVKSPTPTSMVTSYMTLENFLNLWASVSLSVRYEGTTAYGLVLWLKCNDGAWPIGV